VDGTKSASTNSATATVTVTGGEGVFSFVWVGAGNSLISNLPGYFDISRGDRESFTLTVADDLTDIQWSLNGTDIAAPQGTAMSITIDATRYGNGTYNLDLYAKKDNVPYSLNIPFMVVN
jgi:hypothetical protein